MNPSTTSMERQPKRRLLKGLERACLYSGATLVLFAALAWLDGMAQSRSVVEEFESIRDRVAAPAEQKTWSEKRKLDYRQSLGQDAGTTLAVLRIPSAGIEVPVFDSIDSTALNRGAGHVIETALPGSQGNIAIAGHRDGWFRGLNHLEVGAEIEVITLQASRTFRVAELSVVDPLDVSVLAPTEETVLTLITCYPFYYIGPAPDRYIVRAKLVSPEVKRDQQTVGVKANGTS